jgi:tRNA threonylcarbamoyl adenosine modification protein YeaZ
MITLAIDTSTARGGVALLRDGAVLFAENFLADRSHSAHLFSSLERALKIAPRFDRVMVGLGPGSYSGVRIAISAAIGFGLGLDARLLGIASMAAMETTAARYRTIGDARRGTYYYAEISDGVCLEGPLLLEEEALRRKLADGPALPLITSDTLPEFPEADVAYPSAEKLARLAEKGTGIHSTGDLEPIYLREPHITRPKAV